MDAASGGVATLVGEDGQVLTSVLTFDSLIRELNETEVVCSDSEGDSNRTRIVMAGWSEPCRLVYTSRVFTVGNVV